MRIMNPQSKIIGIGGSLGSTYEDKAVHKFDLRKGQYIKTAYVGQTQLKFLSDDRHPLIELNSKQKLVMDMIGNTFGIRAAKIYTKMKNEFELNFDKEDLDEMIELKIVKSIQQGRSIIFGEEAVWTDYNNTLPYKNKFEVELEEVKKVLKRVLAGSDAAVTEAWIILGARAVEL